MPGASIILANPAELADQVAVAQEQSLNMRSLAAPMARGCACPNHGSRGRHGHGVRDGRVGRRG